VTAAWGRINNECLSPGEPTIYHPPATTTINPHPASAPRIHWSTAGSEITPICQEKEVGRQTTKSTSMASAAAAAANCSSCEKHR